MDNKTAALIRTDRMMSGLIRNKWLSVHTAAREEFIPRRDGSFLRLLVVRDGSGENNTGLLWIHGGGYATGFPEQCFLFAERFAAGTNTVMVLPDYRKSGEEPYPAALEDCYIALSWMVSRADRLGIRSDQIFVGGESAGGGLTCALTQMARDIGDINIAFQMPLYPMIDDRHTETSADNHAPVWDTKKNDEAWALYKTDEEPHPYCAPARQKDFRGLPPAFSVIAEAEPFYAETVQYFRSLYEAGVPVCLKEYPGGFHAFDMLAVGSKIRKKAAEAEKKAYRYACTHFFRPQPLSAAEMMEESIEKDTQDEIRKLDSLIGGLK
ncbi:MAG: alpha/beta hydrolase [Solobacterium sp.]|nr:alpha/beta hydrolase [Solobacterium sp.]